MDSASSTSPSDVAPSPPAPALAGLFSYASISKWVEANQFALALNLGLLLLILFFSGGWVSFIAYWGFFFLPGYLLSSLFFSNHLLRTLISIPISFACISLFLFFANLFSPRIINPLVFGFYLLLVLVGWFIARKRWKQDWSSHFDLPPAHSIIASILLLLILLSSVAVYVQFVGKGSLHNDYPIGVFGWDKVIQLGWIHGMAATGTTFLPPSMHNGDAGIESSYLTPGSIYSTGLFARLSGMEYWDAQTLFSAIIFMGIVAGVFFLMCYLFSWRAGIIAALFAAVPTIFFFILDIAGALRVQLGILFIVFLLVLLDLCRSHEKGPFALAGILLGAFVATHLVSLIAVLIPLLFILAHFLRHRGAHSLSNAAWLFALPLIVLLFYLPIAPTEYVGGLLTTDIHLISPLQFDQQQVETVGPILRLIDYFTTLFFGIIGIILVGLDMRKHKGEAAHNKRFPYLLSFIFLGLLTFGFSTFYYHYAGKLRSAFYILFLIPMMGYFLLRIVDSKPFAKLIPNDLHRLLGLFLIFFLLLHPWSIAPNQAAEKVDRPVWNVLQWLENNTPPSAHLMAIFGFYQYSYLLADRPGNYLGAKPVFLEYINGVPHRFDEYCIPGFVRKNPISLSPAPCSTSRVFLNQYDYIIADYYYIKQKEKILGIIEQGIADANFVPAYHFNELYVYRNTQTQPI